MNASLAATVFLMGLAGGPHCVAMCGAACAGLGQAAGRHRGRALWAFQLGRLGGYSALGALAAATVQGLGWLGERVAALQPLWTMLHAAALVLGLALLLRARQPVWLERPARGVWRQVQRLGATRSGPLLLGALWSLLPCGLLWSALLVAALAGDAWAGAGSMALFALGSGLWLLAGPWLWLRLAGTGWRGAQGGVATLRGEWGVRLAGGALAASALWMLVHGTPSGRAFMAWCAG